MQFELKAQERRKSSQERLEEKQESFPFGGVRLTGPTPQARAMSFELTQKKKQASGNQGPGEMFDKQLDLTKEEARAEDPPRRRTQALSNSRKRRCPYKCPQCGAEMTQTVFDSDLEEFGKVACPVCKEAEMERRKK